MEFFSLRTRTSNVGISSSPREFDQHLGPPRSAMTSDYNSPSVEPILEDSEESAMKTTSVRERERSRKHRSAGGSKHSKKHRSVGGRRGLAHSPRENTSDSSRRQQRLKRAGYSTSSSDEDSESVSDHRAILAAARLRLTSPSTISSFTSQTTATNKSSSSSGSNSTVTQASISKYTSAEGKVEASEPPLSPAVPDPPNVFAFLEKDSPEAEGDGQDEAKKELHLSPSQIETTDNANTLPSDVSPKHARSSSSSASGSFRSDDNFSERTADNDTDRSSSPERDSREENARASPPDRSFKMASQLAAAEQRQNAYAAVQQFGTPNMPRGNVNLPHVPSTTLSTRHQHQANRQVLPRAEKLPVTGYELLASRLASFSSNAEEHEVKIKPMYRKFEALNHRLLLHLQDELSELEEQLHRLEIADTQSRRTDRHVIMPASRRAAAQAGGELQWHKTDILGRIGYKLNQYSKFTPFHAEL